jgi:phosphoribosylaminoimidazole-succinocarboxamide synthase
LLKVPDSGVFGQGYHGKVRDTWSLIGEDGEAYFLTVTTDRVSAFDVVSGQTIPGKGLALNAISRYWYRQTRAK